MRHSVQVSQNEQWLTRRVSPLTGEMPLHTALRAAPPIGHALDRVSRSQARLRTRIEAVGLGFRLKQPPFGSL